MSKDKKRNIKKTANLFGGYAYYENRKKIGESRPNLFGGGYTNYDAKGKKVGSSEPQIFGGGYNHYDTHGNKVGSSEPQIFGGESNLYDKNRNCIGSVDKDVFTMAAEAASTASRNASSSSSFRSDAAISSPYALRKFADEGDEYGIDPEDYESEEDYLDAVEEARDEWREKYDDIRWDYDAQPEEFDSEEEYLDAIREEGYSDDSESQFSPDEDSYDAGAADRAALNPSDYPNKRRYNAARILAGNQGSLHPSNLPAR